MGTHLILLTKVFNVGDIILLIRCYFPAQNSQRIDQRYYSEENHLSYMHFDIDFAMKWDLVVLSKVGVFCYYWVQILRIQLVGCKN